MIIVERIFATKMYRSVLRLCKQILDRIQTKKNIQSYFVVYGELRDKLLIVYLIVAENCTFKVARSLLSTSEIMKSELSANMKSTFIYT